VKCLIFKEEMLYLISFLFFLHASKADNLHEATVYLRAWHESDALMIQGLNRSLYERALHLEEATPHTLPVSLHREDGRHMGGLLLRRNTHIEHPLTISYGNKQEHGSLVPEGSAFYQDTLSESTLGLRIKEGQRHFSGKLSLNGAEYELQSQVEKYNKPQPRGFENHIPHCLRRINDDEKISQFEEDIIDQASEKVNTAGDDGDDVIDKRSSPDYHLELAIIIDYSEYYRWLKLTGSEAQAIQEIKYKFSYLYSGLDRLFKTITPSRGGMTIKLWITKLKIITKENESPVKALNPHITEAQWAEPFWHTINGQAVLHHVRDTWGPANGMAVPADADLVNFYQGFKMVTNRGGGMTGMGFMRRVCQRSGYSIVLDRGLEGWSTIAHEVGHNLGAWHDKDFQDREPECHEDLNHVMSGVWGIKDSGMYSVCSLRDIKDTLSRRRCLSNRGSDALCRRVDPMPGKKYNLAWQCAWRNSVHDWNDRQRGGVTNYERITACPSRDRPEMCYKGMYCKGLYKRAGQTKGRCYKSLMNLPADGSPCAPGKICKATQCVHE